MYSLKLSILLLLFSAAGCAWNGPVRSLAVAANRTAVVGELDGTTVMRSHQMHVVSLLPLNTTFSRDTFTLPSFHVIVTNGSNKNVTLKPVDISADVGGRRVALLGPSALQDRLDREQVAVGSRVTFPIMNDASQPAEVRQGHPRHSDPTRPRVEPFNAPTFKVSARHVEEALRSQVIRPGDVGGGRIMLESEDILSGLPLRIVVTVAGETHEFLLEVRY
jgi:hypothetical protein